MQTSHWDKFPDERDNRPNEQDNRPGDRDKNTREQDVYPGHVFTPTDQCEKRTSDWDAFKTRASKTITKTIKRLIHETHHSVKK